MFLSRAKQHEWRRRASHETCMSDHSSLRVEQHEHAKARRFRLEQGGGGVGAAVRLSASWVDK
eukprot:2317601-Amphidinium_carterae.1